MLGMAFLAPLEAAMSDRLPGDDRQGWSPVRPTRKEKVPPTHGERLIGYLVPAVVAGLVLGVLGTFTIGVGVEGQADSGQLKVVFAICAAVGAAIGVGVAHMAETGQHIRNREPHERDDYHSW